MQEALVCSTALQSKERNVSWLVLIINLIQSEITWKKNLNEDLSRSGLPVGMSVGDRLP